MNGCKEINMPLLMLDSVDLIIEIIEIAINTIFYNRFDDETELEIGKKTGFSYYKNKTKSKEIITFLSEVQETIKSDETINFELIFYEKEKTSYFFQTSKEKVWEKWNFSCVLKKTNNNKISDTVKNDLKEKLFKIFEEINNGIDYMPVTFMNNTLQPFEFHILNKPKKKGILGIILGK